MPVADRAYAPGGFGYVGGLEHTFSQPLGGTDDDPLYQDVRIARESDSDGIFAYRSMLPPRVAMASPCISWCPPWTARARS